MTGLKSVSYKGGGWSLKEILHNRLGENCFKFLTESDNKVQRRVLTDFSPCHLWHNRLTTHQTGLTHPSIKFSPPQRIYYNKDLMDFFLTLWPNIAVGKLQQTLVIQVIDLRIGLELWGTFFQATLAWYYVALWCSEFLRNCKYPHEFNCIGIKNLLGCLSFSPRGVQKVSRCSTQDIKV